MLRTGKDISLLVEFCSLILYYRKFYFTIIIFYFTAILDNLQEVRQVPGVVTGKQGANGIYVPTIYSKSQSEWVDNFYKQNGYLGS